MAHSPLLTNTTLLANTTAAPELSAPLSIPPAPRLPPPGAVVIASLLEQFKSIPDVRDQPLVDHPLLDVLLCTLFAMMSDCADYTDLGIWGSSPRRSSRGCAGLLASLELKGALVTLDAMAGPPAIAQQLCEAGADYILALKANEKETLTTVSAHFLALSGPLQAPPHGPGPIHHAASAGDPAVRVDGRVRGARHGGNESRTL